MKMSDGVHFEVLPAVQKKVLRQLGPIADQDGFYLGGGTAIALQLGHRRSIDFDWCTDQSFDDPHRYAGSLRNRGLTWQLEQAAPGTLHGTVDGVKGAVISACSDPSVAWTAATAPLPLNCGVGEPGLGRLAA